MLTTNVDGWWQSIRLVSVTEDLVVVDKPPSIPVHPCGRYRHNTVVFILAKEFGLKNLRTIHRLVRQGCKAEADSSLRRTG